MAKNNSRKSEILEVAKQLFVEQGVDGTSMDHIAKKLQLTKASLYYYFKSKDELLDEMLKESMSKLLGSLLTERQAYLKAKEEHCERAVKIDFQAYIEEKDVLRIALGEAFKKGNKGRIFHDLTEALLEESGEEVGQEEKQRIIVCISGLLIATYFTLKEDISEALGIEETIIDQVFEERYGAMFVDIGKDILLRK